MIKDGGWRMEHLGCGNFTNEDKKSHTFIFLKILISEIILTESVWQYFVN